MMTTRDELVAALEAEPGWYGSVKVYPEKLADALDDAFEALRQTNDYDYARAAFFQSLTGTTTPREE